MSVVEKLSLKGSFLWILGSVLLVSGSGYGLYFYHRHCTKELLQDPQNRVVALIQTGSEKEVLKTNYLAELMELSCDQPVSLFAFDVDKAREKLLMSPLIKEAKVKRIRPNAVYVDYEARKPTASLYDYENIGIDEELFPFPLAPFHPVSSLPEIYLGLIQSHPEEGEEIWHRPLAGKEIALSMRILQMLRRVPSIHPRRIDVSRAFSPSYGKREIVVLLDERLEIPQKHGKALCIFPKILRLNPKDLEQQFANYLVLQQKIASDYQRQLSKKTYACQELVFHPKIIDFRVPQLAFVQE